MISTCDSDFNTGIGICIEYIYRGKNIRGSEVFQYSQKGQSMIEMHAYYGEM